MSPKTCDIYNKNTFVTIKNPRNRICQNDHIIYLPPLNGSSGSASNSPVQILNTNKYTALWSCISGDRTCNVLLHAK